jgi:hypothetical protein
VNAVIQANCHHRQQDVLSVLMALKPRPERRALAETDDQADSYQ